MSKQRVQFDDLFTFTRNSEATYRDPVTGLITDVGLDAPRLESNGLLIEPARTNLLTYSEYQNGVYTPRQNVITSPMSLRSGVTSDAQLFNSVAEEKYAYREFATVSGQWYVFSCFVEFQDDLGPPTFGGAADSNQRPFTLVHAGLPNTTQILVEQITNRTYRVSQIRLASTASQNYGVYRAATNLIRPFKVTGFQLETPQGAASSYIPTEGAAVTRAADDILRTFSTEYSTAEGTFYIEYQPYTYNASNANVMGTLLGTEFARRTGADSYAATNYDFDYAYPAASKTGDFEKLAISINAAGLWTLARNGQAVTYNAGRFDAFGSDMLNVPQVLLMDGGHGRIKNFRYWPRALAGDEMIAEMAL